MNTYALFESIGSTLNVRHPDYIYSSKYESETKWRNFTSKNPKTLLNELTNIGDQLSIYMFHDHSWKMQITKSDTVH